VIESVNSAIANASLLRTQVAREVGELTREVDGQDVASAGVSVQTTRSPELSQPIVQILDANTGDVLSQYPSQGTVAAREGAVEEANKEFFAEMYASQNGDARPVIGQKTAGDIEVQKRDAEQKNITEAQIAIAALYTGSQSGVTPQKLLSTVI
jgi:hypothetical protein